MHDGDIASRLHDERPWPTPLELDRAKRRALASQPRPMRALRPRLALVCIVALGALFSGTGVTLALSGDISASQVVYQPQVTPQVLGQNGSGQPNQPNNQTLPSTETQPTVQGAQQVAASSPTQTLPFTGLAAIPILVIGLGMIVGGAVLARRTRERQI